jgi:hypothetical protein
MHPAAPPDCVFCRNRIRARLHIHRQASGAIGLVVKQSRGAGDEVGRDEFPDETDAALTLMMNIET